MNRNYIITVSQLPGGYWKFTVGYPGGCIEGWRYDHDEAFAAAEAHVERARRLLENGIR